MNYNDALGKLIDKLTTFFTTQYKAAAAMKDEIEHVSDGLITLSGRIKNLENMKK